jgi:hypothetical protein
MAYRRPGIRVTQEFADLLPALAPFNLPNCTIGPAYQVVFGDSLGVYDGSSTVYSYASLRAGAIVDLAVLDGNELPDHQFPISVVIKNAKLAWITGQTDGYVASDLVQFHDASPNAFATVVAGDELEVLETLVSILSLRANGSVTDSATDTLIGATVSEFTDVAVGDLITISAGTDAVVGQYLVSQKIDNQTLKLDAVFFLGTGTAADIGYKVERTTGALNKGSYIVREILDVNTLKLQAPLKVTETLLGYRVLRKMSEIALERDAQYTATANNITLDASLDLSGKAIVDGRVYADYRALRVDLAGSVREYTSLSDIQAVFGVDQVVAANPLAFGLALALQNTVTAVNGLALNANFLVNESLSFQASLDVLKKTNMYALCVLSQSAVIHQLFATHVTQMSGPDKGKERVAIVNKKIITKETLVDTSVTSLTRTMLNTQLAGIVTSAASTLRNSTAIFSAIQAGDVVHIVSGTGVVAGAYVVASKDSDLQLTLTGFTASANGSNVVYYISRADGIESNGTKFYDQNASFISSDVFPGHFFVIESGPIAGRYEILSVNSDHSLTIAQIPGVVTIQAPITYRVEKDLTVTEIAQFMKGYCAAFANRRLVVTFPDIARIPEGNVVLELPGFYFGCSVVALTTGLPTQQGFTNISVSGYLGSVHGREFFDEDQFDIIADGGCMIFDQEVPDAAMFIRHELTTDRSSIKFQEYMVTKNVDFISKFLRNSFKSFIGVYNVVDSTFDELKTVSDAVLKYLKEDTKLGKIGGVIKTGRLVSLAEGTNIDSIAMRFKMDIPVPLNNLDITVQV